MKDGFDMDKVLKDIESGEAYSTVYFPELDILNYNPSNPYPEDEDEEVRLLADNIERHGIMQEGTVYRNRSNLYMISGNKRLKALRLLVEEGRRYKYRGKDITGTMPVTFTTKPGSRENMILNLIAVNSHRDMTREQKMNVLDATVEALESLEKKGLFKWPEGRRRDYLSAETGIANHFVKDYLSERNRQQALAVADEEKKEELVAAQEEKDKTRTYRKTLSQMNGVVRLFQAMKDEKMEMNDQQKEQMKDIATQLYEQIKEYLD